MAAEKQIVRQQQKASDGAEWSKRIGLLRRSWSSSTSRCHSNSNNSHSCNSPSLSKYFASQQVDGSQSLQARQEYSVSSSSMTPQNEGACHSKHPKKQWSKTQMGIIRRKKVTADPTGRLSIDGLSHQCYHKSAARLVEQQSSSTKDESGFISVERPGKDINCIIRGDTMTHSSFAQALPCSSQQSHRASVDGHSRGPNKVCIPGLSHKYQPKSFDEIIGNEIIVKALSNAIQRKRVSPLYLFHGPSGTGKTSTAKIFSTALNCESASPSKPCWKCTSCSRSLYTAELCSGNRNSALGNMRTLLEGTAFVQTFPGFKVFIINECHSLAEYSWGELLEMIEENYGGSLVIILITEDAKAIPKTISSRCQKFAFAKLKDCDITHKLAKIASHEGIEITKDALKLLATKADGNLREAEILLDQLALLGQCITASSVQQLVRTLSHFLSSTVKRLLAHYLNVAALFLLTISFFSDICLFIGGSGLT